MQAHRMSGASKRKRDMHTEVIRIEQGREREIERGEERQGGRPICKEFFFCLGV